MFILYAANTYHYNTLCVHLYKNIKEKNTLSHTFDAMLSKHTIMIIIFLCTQKSILFAADSYHFTHSLRTHLLLNIFAMI